MVPLEQRVRQELVEKRVLLVKEVSRVSRVLPEEQAYRDQQDKLAQLALKVNRDSQEVLDLQVQQDPVVQRDLEVLLEHRVQMVSKGPLVLPVLLAHLALWGLQGLPELLVSRVLKVLQVFKDLEVYKGLLVQRVRLAQWGQVELRVLQASRALSELQVPQDYLAKKDLEVIQAVQDPKVHKAHKELLDFKD